MTIKFNNDKEAEQYFSNKFNRNISFSKEIYVRDDYVFYRRIMVDGQLSEDIELNNRIIDEYLRISDGLNG